MATFVLVVRACIFFGSKRLHPSARFKGAAYLMFPLVTYMLTRGCLCVDFLFLSGGMCFQANQRLAPGGRGRFPEMAATAEKVQGLVRKLSTCSFWAAEKPT